MSYRKGAAFKLVTNGIKEEETIPPMVFHTLIENGLTHGYGSKDKGTFTLTRNDSDKTIDYIVTNDGEFIDSEKKDSNGMGLKYVEARLEESFPGKWELYSDKKSNGWEVIIKIKKQN
jgi:LytS/YehU family sensor histidine kinase